MVTLMQCSAYCAVIYEYSTAGWIYDKTNQKQAFCAVKQWITISAVSKISVEQNISSNFKATSGEIKEELSSKKKQNTHLSSKQNKSRRQES